MKTHKSYTNDEWDGWQHECHQLASRVTVDEALEKLPREVSREERVALKRALEKGLGISSGPLHFETSKSTRAPFWKDPSAALGALKSAFDASSLPKIDSLIKSPDTPALFPKPRLLRGRFGV